MQITSIKPCKKGLSLVLADGEWYKIDTATLENQGIREGMEISFEDFEEINRLSNCNRAYEKALYLLDYRDRTYTEIKRKLSESFSPEGVEYALARVCELGLIDDENFARKFASELFNYKKYGENRVANELYRRGIDREIVDRVLSEFSYDCEERIAEIVRERYMPLPQDKKEMARIVNALMRQGYKYSDIKNALNLLED